MPRLLFSYQLWQTGELGFEPRQTDSETVVLPLHHSPSTFRILAILIGEINLRS